MARGLLRTFQNCRKQWKFCTPNCGRYSHTEINTTYHFGCLTKNTPLNASTNASLACLAKCWSEFSSRQILHKLLSLCKILRERNCQLRLSFSWHVQNIHLVLIGEEYFSTWKNKTKQTKQDKTKQNKTKQNKTKQNKTKNKKPRLIYLTICDYVKWVHHVYQLYINTPI